MQPFWLDTADKERLFCWHVVPLDVYLENEHELVAAVTTGEVVDDLRGTVGEKLLRRDKESRVVVNFHGVSCGVFIFVRVTAFLCTFSGKGPGIPLLLWVSDTISCLFIVLHLISSFFVNLCLDLPS